MFSKVIRYLSVSFVLILTACGGGGGGGASSSTTPSTLAFPLKQAITAFNASGHSSNMSGTVAGSARTCNVTSSARETPANTVTSFEGKTALSTTSTTIISYSGCSDGANVPSSTTVTTYFYDTNYVDLGSASSSEFSDYAAGPNYPVTVKVGDTGIFGTKNSYIDSTKASLTNSSISSYVIEADTATTAIVNAKYENYDASNKLQYTGQSRYRITSAGVLTPLSVTVNYTNGAVLSLTAQ